MGVGVLKGGSAAAAADVGRPAVRGLALKRALDVTVALVVLVVLAPVLIVLAAAILIMDGRPILFRQRRVGRHGEHFTMFKFRTMVPDAEQRLGEVAHANERKGPLFKAADDPRVTRIGRFLRRTSLDELPQFYNVLNGTMSLVGPRPALPEEREHFPSELLGRERMPQGITGLWQVEGRNLSDFAVYRDLDLDYVDNWSLGRDLGILVRTPLAVVQHAVRRPGSPPELVAAVDQPTATLVPPASHGSDHLAPSLVHAASVAADPASAA